MKILLDIERGMFADKVADDATFEVPSAMEWVDCPVEFENSNTALKLNEDGVIVKLYNIPVGGSPKLQRNYDLRHMKIVHEGKTFNADKTSQEALARNAFVNDTFDWVTDENEIISLTADEAKVILKTMVLKSTSLMTEYQTTMADLVAEGYTEAELSNTRGEDKIDEG